MSENKAGEEQSGATNGAAKGTPKDPARRDLLLGSLIAGLAAGGVGSALPEGAHAQGSAIKPTDSADVVIVGAGFAGLAAARALKAAGRSVIIVDGRDRVGGRAYSEQVKLGGWVDMGAQWLGPDQTRVLEIAKEVGAQTFPSHVEGKGVLIIGGKRSTFTMVPKEEYPGFSEAEMADVAQAFSSLDTMAAAVPKDAPWSAPKAREWDSMTLESWMDQNVKTAAGRAAVRIFVLGYQACEPSDISLLHMLFYIAAGGGFESLHVGGIAYRVVGGTFQIAAGMAKDLQDAIRLGTTVITIDQSAADKVRVATNKGVLEGKRVIVACAPAMANLLNYVPDLPASRMQFTQRVPMGSSIKCHVVYPTPFWREKGLSGITTSDSTPLSFTFDNSPPSGKPGILAAFFEGQESRAFAGKPEAEIRKTIIDNLVEFFGSEAANPAEVFIKIWDADPWARGCFSGIMPPSVWTDYPDAIRRPVDRIHWAGTETATRWYAYLEGAVQSGERAAKEVNGKL